MKAFDDILIDRMGGNEEIFESLMGDADVGGITANDIAWSLYRCFRGSETSRADG